jgi:replicative DNA helicase
MSLIDSVPTAANIKHYAEIVAQKSLLRRIAASAHEVYGAAMNCEPDAAERFVAKAIAVQSKRGGRVRKAREVISIVHQRIGDYKGGKPKTGIPFGIPHLDRISRGAVDGELLLVGGRPSEGKTVLLTQLAVQAALAGKNTLMFSEEMDAEDIMERAIFMRARVDGEAARDGTLKDEEWDRITDRANELYETPWWISDLPATIASIVATTKQYILQHQIGIVLVDYLQIVQCPGRYENRNLQVQDMVAQLRALARTHRIPVVVATQLSRETTRRANPEPILADLREGGNQEGDAHKVIFVWNPYREECDEGNPSCIAMLKVAKNRNGKIGKCCVRWIPQWTRFEDSEEKWVPPGRQERSGFNGLQ